jgi:hypothetical protein
MLVDADYIARSGTSLEIVNLVVFEVESENENIIANISEKFVIALVANESIVADAAIESVVAFVTRQFISRIIPSQPVGINLATPI